MKATGILGLLLLAGMALGPARLVAQPDHIFSYSMTPTDTPTPTTASIDVDKDECVSRAKSVSQTCACLEASQASWQLELDKAMAKLQTAVTGTAGAAALSQAQADWLRYRDSELACAESVFAADSGAAAKLCAARSALVAARARELDALIAPLTPK